MFEHTEQQSTDEQRRAQALSLKRLRPPTHVPGYEPRRFLGAGAYGEVWVAVDCNTGRQVAIKFYEHRGGLDWSLLSREVEKLAFLSADRYVVQAALAVAHGKPVPDPVTDAFAKLPKVMARADARAGQIDRAVIDMAEAVMLAGNEGETMGAVVTDIGERGASIQLCDLPVTARVEPSGLTPGDPIDVRLTQADPRARKIAFERLS